MNRLHSFILVVCLATIPGSVFAGSVNINKASVKSLAMNIKGIGLQKAEAIVAYRKLHGSFRSVDDLVKVKGIGVKTVKTNRLDLRIVEPTAKK